MRMKVELVRVVFDGYFHLSMTRTSWYKRKFNKPSGKWKPCFIRFGGIPKDEKSFNHRQEYYEKGVSVYNGLKRGKRGVPIIPNEDAINSFSVVQRVAYFVEGKVVGAGSDGEPLLRNIKILSVADVPVCDYRQKFKYIEDMDSIKEEHAGGLIWI